MESIIMDLKDKHCYNCGCQKEYWIKLHHVMFGTANRKLSDKYGLVIWLCIDCHTGTERGVHHNRELDLHLRRIAQRKFENIYGHEKWMEVFGRNYL